MQRITATGCLLFTPANRPELFGKARKCGRLQVGEAFLVGALTALTTRNFGRAIANLGWTDTRLPVPVYAGDQIHAVSEILAKRF